MVINHSFSLFFICITILKIISAALNAYVLMSNFISNDSSNDSSKGTSKDSSSDRRPYFKSVFLFIRKIGLYCQYCRVVVILSCFEIAIEFLIRESVSAAM